MSNNTYDTVLRVNITKLGKDKLHLLSEWLFEHQFVYENTISEATRWCFDIGFHLARTLNSYIDNGKPVNSINIPIENLKYIRPTRKNFVDPFLEKYNKRPEQLKEQYYEPINKVEEKEKNLEEEKKEEGFYNQKNNKQTYVDIYNFDSAIFDKNNEQENVEGTENE